jgi:hypothetical protein
MNSLFSSINDGARKLWSMVSGRTANLNALADYAKTLGTLQSSRSVSNASMASIFPWHQVGHEGANLLLWQPDGNGGMAASPQNPTTFAVTRQERINFVELSIRDVQGLSSSKGPIENFSELDDFATTCCTDLLSDVSPQAARELLSKGNIRLWVDGREPKGAPDNFVWHQWDERIFFNNSDGSHHFAAARWISLQNRTNIKVGASLTLHTINMATVINLVNQFDMFFVGKPAPAVPSCGMGSGLESDEVLHHLLSRLQTPWAHLSLPRCAHDGFLLILPKASDRSREVAQLLRDAGLTDAGHLLSAAALNRPFFPTSTVRAA